MMRIKLNVDPKRRLQWDVKLSKITGRYTGSTMKTCLRADRNLNTKKLTETNNKYNVI